MKLIDFLNLNYYVLEQQRGIMKTAHSLEAPSHPQKRCSPSFNRFRWSVGLRRFSCSLRQISSRWRRSPLLRLHQSPTALSPSGWLRMCQLMLMLQFSWNRFTRQVGVLGYSSAQGNLEFICCSRRAWDINMAQKLRTNWQGLETS